MVGDERGVGAMVVRGTTAGALMTVRARNTKWTAAEKAGFLDALAATGNVSRAARAVGRTDEGAHGLRRRDPAFAAACREALDAASDLLQAAVLEHALAGKACGMTDEAPEGSVAATPCPTCGAGGERPFDPDLALRVLNQRATRAAAPRQAPVSNYRRMSIEEVEASLNRKIDTILRGRERAQKRAGSAA